eukprot:5107187-Pleurochrysis_carterae.AAC.1
MSIAVALASETATATARQGQSSHKAGVDCDPAAAEPSSPSKHHWSHQGCPHQRQRLNLRSLDSEWINQICRQGEAHPRQAPKYSLAQLVEAVAAAHCRKTSPSLVRKSLPCP